MQVKFKRRSRGASTKAIHNMVPAAAVTEHHDWIAFLKEHDGAIPDGNQFDVSPDGGSGIQRFLSVAEARATKRRLVDRLPDAFLPVAEAEGGNYICLGLSPSSSGVIFWDHETERGTPVALTFQDFIDNLRQFDPDSIVLRPGQVISAWIDPSLLEAENGTKD